MRNNRMRKAAPYELRKARLCASVVLTTDENEESASATVASLKSSLGACWTATAAFQFMSGRQAELAVACASSEEKPRLYLAHWIAKEVCRADWSAADKPGGIDIAKLRALVAADAEKQDL